MRKNIRTGVVLGISGLALSGAAVLTPAAQASTVGHTTATGQAGSTATALACGRKRCKRYKHQKRARVVVFKRHYFGPLGDFHERGLGIKTRGTGFGGLGFGGFGFGGLGFGGFGF
ncbi:hypothetical protein [Actinomadura keratinilytica]|uniref:Uncharacterized protein n=1 Tax=Actinomadura keratinilytica TaxID=547461 RepID=A0ABP7ZDC1_9ACTN